MKKLNVLSLFDGMSCGQIALDQLGIPIEKYYASELDKFAIKVTQHNYPHTIQLGDVTNWRDWKIDWSEIDLIYGGSPCQGFSFAGKQLAFDDPRSKLFFVFVEIINHIKKVNPNVKFLLENVRMKQEYLDIISEHMGVQPVKINSALLSAQNRVRYYWTNIAELDQPEECGLVIADIFNINIVNKKQNKILMTKFNFKVKVRKNYIDTVELGKYLRSFKNKTINEIAKYCEVPKTKAEHWFRLDSSFAIPTPEAWIKLKELLNITTDKFDKQINEFEIKNNTYDMAKRIYHIDGKHPTLTTLTGGGQRKTITNGKDLFYLTPEHAEALQTVPIKYTCTVSDRQRYRMLGNGWTIEIIKHIFKNLITHNTN